MANIKNNTKIPKNAKPSKLTEKNIKIDSALQNVENQLKNMMNGENQVIKASVSNKQTLPTGFIDVNELKEYMQMAAHQVNEEKAYVKSKNRQMDDTFKSFDNILPEFTKCCMVIGYNLLGEKFVYAYLPTERDKDAMVEHMKNVFMRMVMSQQGG